MAKLSTRSISIWMDNGTKREKIAEKCFFTFTNQLFCNTQMTKQPVTTNQSLDAELGEKLVFTASPFEI